MKRRCWVFVLGDFGRSPRMQYHTESLLNKNLAVTVIASPGSPPLSSIHNHPSFTLASVPTPPLWQQRLHPLLHLIVKAVYQLLALCILMLIKLERPDFVLVQIPPAIPTLFVCAAVRIFRRTKIFFDWHNFAYTLMQLDPKTPTSLTECSRWIERHAGRWADGHFCVSMAMQARLKRWKIDAAVVYDRPHGRYRPADVRSAHDLFRKLRQEMITPMHSEDVCSRVYASLSPQDTILTMDKGGTLEWKTSRPAVVVSSTSWTPDEDFSILLSALEAYDRQPPSTRRPDLLVCITGKGMQKQYYIEKMQRMKFESVAVRTLWLEPEDYPVLLGAADMGISLHTSSSGVDLPMKVVDMFGCGLPVCSADYPAIGELVRSGENGVLFKDANELSEALGQLLDGFPFRTEDDVSLMRMRRYLQTHQESNWDENWNRTAWPQLSD